jgi:hypothetical protein
MPRQRQSKKEYDRAYRERNRERLRAQQRRYREQNRERIRVRQREHYDSNREQILAQQREYYDSNREQILGRRREYYDSNRERLRARRREVRMQARAKLVDEKGGRCAHCGETDTQVLCFHHHPISRAELRRRGHVVLRSASFELPSVQVDIRKNTILLCANCHARVHWKSI